MSKDVDFIKNGILHNLIKADMELIKNSVESFKKEKLEFMNFVKKFYKKHDEMELELSKKLIQTKNMCQQLEKIRETNENIEETICNVLLAIRQNEYLQAWYPAQKGFPEMKVCGKHPMNTEKKSEIA